MFFSDSTAVDCPGSRKASDGDASTPVLRPAAGSPMNRTDATVMPISPLGREALDWVVRLNSGDATRQDASDLAAWRARSAEHEAAFREAVRVRRGLQGLIEAREAEKVIVFPPRRATVSRRAFVAGGGALAASI